MNNDPRDRVEITVKPRFLGWGAVVKRRIMDPVEDPRNRGSHCCVGYYADCPVLERRRCPSSYGTSPSRPAGGGVASGTLSTAWPTGSSQSSAVSAAGSPVVPGAWRSSALTSRVAKPAAWAASALACSST